LETHLNQSATSGPSSRIGKSVVGTVYNGAYVGPPLRLRPGDRLELDLINELAELERVMDFGPQ
jgi:FtsP/CotA-like multicopper oxidase with cupredoxin domain